MVAEGVEGVGRYPAHRCARLALRPLVDDDAAPRAIAAATQAEGHGRRRRDDQRRRRRLRHGRGRRRRRRWRGQRRRWRFGRRGADVVAMTELTVGGEGPVRHGRGQRVGRGVIAAHAALLEAPRRRRRRAARAVARLSAPGAVEGAPGVAPVARRVDCGSPSTHAHAQVRRGRRSWGSGQSNGGLCGWRTDLILGVAVHHRPFLLHVLRRDAAQPVAHLVGGGSVTSSQG